MSTELDREPRPLGWAFAKDQDDGLDLPEDLTASEYRRRARALLQQAHEEPHGPRADRMVATALVFATCARSAPEDPT